MLLTFAFCVIVSISACEDGPEKKEIPPTVNLDFFTAKDQGNEGNGSDIFLGCRLSGSIDKYQKLRFILTSSASGFDVTKALALTPDSYVEINAASFNETYLSAGLKDSDGQLISEGKPYTSFILLLPAAGAGDPLLIQAPEVLSLADEIVVITPKFTGAISADEDISIDSENNLYVSGGKSSPTTLFKISADGTVVALSTKLNYAVGNTLDANGNVYVTNYESTNINLVTPAGATSVFINDAKLTGGGGIIIDNNGMIYNTFFLTKTLFKMSPAGTIEDFVVSNSLNGPVGLAYDRAKDLIFVSNFGDGKIFQVTSNGSMSEVADTPAHIGHLDYLNDVLYVTGFNENKIYLVSMEGEILMTIGNGNKTSIDGVSSEASFFNPNGIAVSKDGKFIYVSQMDGILRKIIL